MSFPLNFDFHGDEGNHCCDGGRHVWLSGQVSNNGRIDWHLRAENRVAISPSYEFRGRIYVRDAAQNVLFDCSCGPINVGGNIFGPGRGQVDGTAQIPADILPRARDVAVTAGGQDTLFRNFPNIGDALRAGAAIAIGLL